MEKVGCKPPYPNSTPAYAPCTEQKELAKAFQIYQAAIERGNRGLPDTIDIPCRSLRMVRYDVKDVETPDVWIKKWPWMNTSVGVILNFAEFTYKEVKSVRGMNKQALIGKLFLLTSVADFMRAVYLFKSSLKRQRNISCNNHIWFTGNAGGYLGLFLGYALLNVPELFQGVLNWWNEKKNKGMNASYVIPL